MKFSIFLNFKFWPLLGVKGLSKCVIVHDKYLPDIKIVTYLGFWLLNFIFVIHLYSQNLDVYVPIRKINKLKI